MQRTAIRFVTAQAIGCILGSCLAGPAGADPAGALRYAQMAPLQQYLMADRDREIALARSAAPASVASKATVMVLGPKGYEDAVAGGNGFTCLVERSWMNTFDNAEFWNPKTRAPVCYNAAASRSVMQYTLFRTALVMAGVTKAELPARIRAALAQKKLVPPETGAMSYMMAKAGYLNDGAGAWHSHLMFHLPKTDVGTWGANLPGSPIVVDTEHTDAPEPQVVFLVPIGFWSDGSEAPVHAR